MRVLHTTSLALAALSLSLSLSAGCGETTSSDVGATLPGNGAPGGSPGGSSQGAAGGSPAGTGGSTAGNAGNANAGNANAGNANAGNANGGAGGVVVMCDLPPAPSPTVPPQPGCYENDQGAGWLAVPCLCDLWMVNTKPVSATIIVELTATPPDPAPALTGPQEITVTFDDADGAWFSAWSAGSGAGQSFGLTYDGGKTTVRMGASVVVLPPAPLVACETRKAVALLEGGSSTATLAMHGVIENGNGAFAMADGTCDHPPMP